VRDCRASCVGETDDAIESDKDQDTWEREEKESMMGQIVSEGT
jgi:hypothetical protein